MEPEINVITVMFGITIITLFFIIAGMLVVYLWNALDKLKKLEKDLFKVRDELSINTERLYINTATNDWLVAIMREKFNLK